MFLVFDITIEVACILDDQSFYIYEKIITFKAKNDTIC